MRPVWSQAQGHQLVNQIRSRAQQPGELEGDKTKGIAGSSTHPGEAADMTEHMWDMSELVKQLDEYKRSSRIMQRALLHIAGMPEQQRTSASEIAQKALEKAHG